MLLNYASREENCIGFLILNSFLLMHSDRTLKASVLHCLFSLSFYIANNKSSYNELHEISSNNYKLNIAFLYEHPQNKTKI